MNIHKTIALSLVGISTCCGLVLTSVRSYADGDSAVSNASVTVPVACSMAGHTDIAHNASLIPGTYSGASDSEYEQGIGKTTLTTFCNDNNGFSIYAIGFTGDSYDSENHTKLVGTSASGNATIPTKVYESSDTTSNWSMKVTKVDDSTKSYNPQNMTIANSFNNWHIVPDTYTKVAEYKATAGSSTTDTALGAKVETTYASYIAPTQAADTYSGKVKYVMVHPYDHAAPTTPDPNSCTTPVPNLTYMQDLNSSNKATILAGMTEDAQYFLKDARDEKSYCVAKLKDGNIWMTQDLDHDIVTTQNFYTNENTDIGWNSGTNSYDTTTWTANLATLATGTTSWNDGTIVEDGRYDQESYDPGNVYISSDYINAWVAYYESCDTGTLDNCDSSLRPIEPYTRIDIEPVLTGNQHYRIGNYYNWSAAIATNDTRSIARYYQQQDLNRSICPANWTLPKGGDINGNGSIRYLVNQYGYDDDTMMLGGGYLPFTSPLYFNLPGTWYAEFDYAGSYGAYWTSVLSGWEVPSAYNIHIDTIQYEDYYFDGMISPIFNTYDSNGNPVRCVSR